MPAGNTLKVTVNHDKREGHVECEHSQRSVFINEDAFNEAALTYQHLLMLRMRHSPAFFEFIRISKIYVRDTYSIVLQNVIKTNIKYFKLGNFPITPLPFICGRDNIQFYLLLCHIDCKCPVNPQMFMATQAEMKYLTTKISCI